MAYCSKCGTQLSEGAKFCPKCGNPVTPTQAKNDSVENRLSYSLELISSGPAILQMTKILMDLLGIEMREAKDIINSTPSVLVTGISLSRAEEIAQILQSAGAEIEIKQSEKTNIVEKSFQNVVKQSHKPIIKEQPLQYNDSLTEESSKNIWEFVGVCVICFFVFCFFLMKCVGNGSSDRHSSSSSSTRTEQKQEQKTATKPDFLGTYEIRDNAGISFHFILNENGTVKIVFNPDIENGRHYTLTGKWKDNRKENCGIQINYDDIDRIPAVEFPMGIHCEWADKCAYLCDGYYYPDYFTCHKREKGWRIKYTKIK